MAAADYTIDQEAWWVEQWVDLLNAYRFKKRLERGRKYAREGHIRSLAFRGSKVAAQVQGTAADPYRLSIWIDPFTDEDWDFVIDTMAQQAVYSAQLLAGEMPDNIESVFTANGLNLFPFTLSDVHSKCDCPDPKNPCKHIAAVYYQLGDFFREDPFVLFQLRGRTQAQILEALRQRRRQQAAEGAAGAEATDQADNQADDSPQATEAMAEPVPAEPIPVEAAATVKAPAAASPLDLTQFWQYDDPLDSALVVITPGDSTVLDVLGPVPLPADEARAVMGYLKAVYQTVGQQAMIAALS